MRDLWFYRWMSGFGFLNYRAKIMLMAFIGTHIPLIALASYSAFQSAPDWATFFSTVGITLIATLAGTGLTLFVLNELLRPVVKTSNALRAYRDTRTPSALPTHFADEVGTLMADAGTTIMHLEAVRDALEHVDAGTGLANRKRLLQRLGRRDGASGKFALAVIRYANLHRIVEALDTKRAQRAMKLVADRLGEGLPMGADLARISDDEFAVLLPGEDGLQAASTIEAMIARGGEELVLGDLTLSPDLLCGLAECAGGAGDMASLLDQAASAAAMATRSQPIAFHCAKTRVRSVERLRIEQELRRALDRDEFRLHYQPVVDLAAGRVRGAEALIRWQHPEQGLVFPGAFIQAAESSGLIDPMGLWVMRETCAQIGAWNAQAKRDLKVAINLSARQFLDADLTNHVAEAIGAAGIEPCQLELELTETAAMADHEHTKRVFTRLRDLGVSIAIDDFGTGYASMSYLRKLPFDKLKIDREFVTNVHKLPGSQAICRALVALSQGLSLKVLAEGTETEDEVGFLAGIGCDLFQGYVFAKPMPADEFATAIDALSLRSMLRRMSPFAEEALLSEAS